MKGKLETSQILRAVVNEEHGLGMGGVMSHVAINDVPNYHKFLLTTDGGMNVAPNFNMKLGILVNAVNTLRALGYEEPKVAVLANSEKGGPEDSGICGGRKTEGYVYRRQDQKLYRGGTCGPGHRPGQSTRRGEAF